MLAIAISADRVLAGFDTDTLRASEHNPGEAATEWYQEQPAPKPFTGTVHRPVILSDTTAGRTAALTDVGFLSVMTSSAQLSGFMDRPSFHSLGLVGLSVCSIEPA
jgi:hypothetical protein